MTELYLAFNVGHCNGSMSLRITVNNQILFDRNNINDKHLVVKSRIPMPCQLVFTVGNKDMDCDTEVNTQGEIVNDKFIEITEFRLARQDVNIERLYKMFGQTYWGTPGSKFININDTDPVSWHLRD